MFKSSQFTRSAVIAATMIALGAGSAGARPADSPAGVKRAVADQAIATRHWTQPSVDATGVRPADLPVLSTPPAAVPVTRPADGSDGLQWLLFPLAALMISLVLIVAVARAAWHAAGTFRARHV
jgi:hypothetical protein